MNKKPLIIGIDPGTTTAIAFLDVEGKPLEVKSSRKFPKEKIIEEIREKGSPMIIGTDKNPLPSSLEEIVTQFKCEVNIPNEDLSREKKNELTDQHRDLIDNEHEKDALAAAIHSQKSYRSQLDKIKRRNPDKYSQIVRKKLLGMERKKKKKEKREEKDRKRHSGNGEYLKEIENLKKKIDRLEKKLERKKGKNEELEREIENLKTGKGIKKQMNYLESKIKKLEHEKNKIKNKLKKILETSEQGELKTMNEEEMKNTIYTESREKFKELKEKGKKALLIDIIHQEPMKRNKEPNKIYYREIDRIEPKKENLKGMIKKYKNKRKNQK